MTSIQETDTPCGHVRIGTIIKITKVKVETNMFPDGIDHQTLRLEGKTGTINHIGPNSLTGTWGGLSLLTDVDKFQIIKY